MLNKKNGKNLYFRIRKKFAAKLNLYNLNSAEIRTKEEWENFETKNKKIYALATELNQELKKAREKKGSSFYFKKELKGLHFWFKKNILCHTKKGVCIYCDSVVDFSYNLLMEFLVEGYDDVAFREMLTCPKCFNSNRIRAMLYIVNKFVNNRKNLKIYCYEQITPFYNALKNWYGKDSTVIGSEFVDFNLPSGTLINESTAKDNNYNLAFNSIVDEIRHENALDLSFEDESLDFIISNDVYEHVPDIMQTFKEAYRALKKDGYLIFSIPFFIDKNETLIRAKIEAGDLVLLMEKEIHGNPVSSEGSLAFYHFGWDILKMQKEVGFKDPHIILISDEKFGHIDYSPIAVFVAKKEI